jgi:peptidoglycan hydrolase CwlO-like protein
MTESDYQYQIRVSEQNIQNCYAEINKCNREIEELQSMASRLQKVGDALSSASNSGTGKINRLLQSFAAAGRALKGKLFGTVEALYTGPEYNRSCSSVEESMRSVYRKIDELQQKIENCYRQINANQDKISSCRQSIALLAAESEG